MTGPPTGPFGRSALGAEASAARPTLGRPDGSRNARGPRSGHRALWETAVPLAVGIGVVATLVATGVIDWHPAASNSVAFREAESLSLTAVSSGLGGSWSVLGAVGFDDRTATTVTASDLTDLLGSNCTASPLPGAPLSLSLVIPAFSGSFGQGVAPLWIVFVTSGSGGSFVVVEVAGGSASPLAKIGGTNCSFTRGTAQPLPATTVDSPLVAGTTWSEMGSSWVRVEPDLTSVTLAAFGAGTYLGVVESGVWAVIYAPCNPLLGGSVEETALLAAFNLTSGDLTASFSHGLDCPA